MRITPSPLDCGGPLSRDILCSAANTDEKHFIPYVGIAMDQIPISIRDVKEGDTDRSVWARFVYQLPNGGSDVVMRHVVFCDQLPLYLLWGNEFHEVEISDWVTANGGYWKPDGFLKDKIAELFATDGESKKLALRARK